MIFRSYEFLTIRKPINSQYTNRIIMKDCPGSADDEANVEVVRKVRNHGVSIHLSADAVIASGAVDFYLAGTARTRESGSQIGVHS
ncbi:MAG: hypothetical protein ACI94Y_004409 [Maribacter sp.]